MSLLARLQQFQISSLHVNSLTPPTSLVRLVCCTAVVVCLCAGIRLFAGVSEPLDSIQQLPDVPPELGGGVACVRSRCVRTHYVWIFLECFGVLCMSMTRAHGGGALSHSRDRIGHRVCMQPMADKECGGKFGSVVGAHYCSCPNCCADAAGVFPFAHTAPRLACNLSPSPIRVCCCLGAGCC